MKTKVGVLSKCQVEGRPLLEALLERLSSSPSTSSLLSQIDLFEVKKEELPGRLSALQEAEVLIADPPLVAPYLSSLSSLKWMQSTFAGVNHVTEKGEKGKFQLTRLGGFMGKPMTEFVIGTIISTERRFEEFYQCQKRKEWNPPPLYYRTLDQLTLGVMGATGEIGSSIIFAASSLGMKIKGYSRNPRRGGEEGALKEGQLYSGKSSLPEFLKGLDFLVSVLPSTPETKGLLSGDVLKVCQNTVLINVGRGDLIDEDSVIRALENKWLSKAVLDVFETEPLPSHSKLWDRSDVTITPHIAAQTFPEFIVAIATQNLERYLNSLPLEHLVDLEKGY